MKFNSCWRLFHSLLLLLLLLHASSLSAHPSVSSARGTLRNSHILGTNLTLFVANLVLDSPLFSADAAACPPCPSPPACASPSSSACDFSTHSSCAAALSLLSSPQPPSPPTSCPCAPETVRLWCSPPIPPFSTLTLDDPQWSAPALLYSSAALLYRFHVPDPCRGFRVLLMPHSGRISARLSSSSPSPSPSHAASAHLVDSSFSYLACPGSAFHASATFSLLVEPLSSYANFSVRVVSVPYLLPTNAPPPSSSPPPSALSPSSTIHPLSPGVPLAASFPPATSPPVSSSATRHVQVVHFSYTVASCQLLLVQPLLLSPDLFLTLLLSSSPRPSLDPFLRHHSFTLFQESSRVLSLCPDANASSATLYLDAMADTPLLSSLSLQLVVTPLPLLPPNASSLVPLASPATPMLLNSLRGGMTLTCKNPDDDSPSAPPLVFTCNPSSMYFSPDECQAFSVYPYTATQSTNLRPVLPSLFAFHPALFSVVFPDDPNVAAADRLNFVLSMEIRDLRRHAAPFPYDAEYFLDSCDLSFNAFSPFFGADGSIPRMTRRVVLEPSLPCTLENWAPLDAALTSLVAQSREASRRRQSLQQIAYSYLYETATFSGLWVSCRLSLDRFLSSVVDRIYHKQTTSCFDTQQDPCCLPKLSWAQCCHPRDFNDVVTFLFGVNDSLVQQASCQRPKCVSALLEEYSSLHFLTLTENRCAPTLPDLRQYFAAQTQFLATCFSRYFDPSLSCRATGTCPYGFFCNPLSLLCVPPSHDVQRALYFQCLADEISPQLEHYYVVALTNGTVGSSVLTEEILQQRATVSDCRSFNSSVTRRSLVRETAPLVPSCYACRTLCPNNMCPRDFGCSDFPARLSPCTNHLTRVESAGNAYLCDATSVCNWDNSVPLSKCAPAPAKADATHFCGICISPDNCLEVPGPSSAAACAARSICFLHDGSYRTDLSPSQCAALSSCSAPSCNGGCNPTSCPRAGTCSSDELLDIRLRLGNASAGFCALPMESYNIPDCGATSWERFPSSYGCIAYRTCTADACVPAYNTPPSCSAAGGKWFPFPADIAACLTPTTCKEQEVWSPKSSQECRSCDATYAPANAWNSGTWQAARSYPLSWVNRAVVRPYAMGTAIDFPLLEQVAWQAMVDSLSNNFASDLQCRYLVTQKLFFRVLCACNSTQSDCFEPITTDQQLIEVCFDAQFYFVYPPLVTSTTALSFAPGFTGCVNIYISSRTSESFKPPPSSPITTFTSRPKTKYLRSESVINSHGAVVGQAVGDAISISFFDDSDMQARLKSLSICINQKAGIELRLDKYPTIDFAMPSSENADQLVPLGLLVTLLADGSICSSNFQFTLPETTLVPIIRSDNWVTEKSNTGLTTGEMAVLYIVATCFLIPSLLLFGEFCYITYVSHQYSLRQTANLMFVFFFVQCVIRTIYFYLLASEVWDNNVDLGQYVLIELPSFFYLAAILLLTFSFAFILLRRKFRDVQKYFWPSFLLSMLLLALFFAAILITIQVLVLDYKPLVDPSICADLVYTEDDTQVNSSTTIRLVYQSIIAAIAFGIFFTLFVVGFIVYRKTSSQGYGASKMLRLVLVASLGILADSLAFIIYYQRDDPTPYFTVVLIVTEVIPVCILILLLHTKPPPPEHSGSFRPSKEARSSSPHLPRESASD